MGGPAREPVDKSDELNGVDLACQAPVAAREACDSAVMLIVMAGLPAAGKSSVAKGLGRALPAAVVSVDPVEAAMRRAGVNRDQPTGLAAYLVAEAVADDVLALGQSVIIDAVNAVEAARRQWRALADRHRVPVAFIEVVCSDSRVHRQRLEHRSRDILGFEEPTWEAVQQRRDEYEPWTHHRLVLDSIADLTSNMAKAREYLAQQHGPHSPRSDKRIRTCNAAAGWSRLRGEDSSRCVALEAVSRVVFQLPGRAREKHVDFFFSRRWCQASRVRGETSRLARRVRAGAGRVRRAPGPASWASGWAPVGAAR